MQNKTLRNFIYSLGNVANTMSYQVFTARIQFFYLDYLRLGAGVNWVWVLFGIWNAVNDPLMGQISDRTRSRWGRRVPYVFFGAIPLGLSFFLMWTPPTVSPWLTVGWYLAMIFVFDTFFSLIGMAYHSLFAELAMGVRERASLSAVREALSVVGLLAAFLVAIPLSKSLGFVAMGAVVGVTTAVFYSVSVLGVKENPRPEKEKVIGAWESFKIAVSYIPFRWYLAASVLKQYVFVILAATLPFWSKYVLNITEPTTLLGIRLSPQDQEDIMLGLAFIVAVPCLAIWRAVATRVGARRAWVYASLSFIPSLLIVLAARDFVTGFIGTVLAAPGLAGYMMLPVILLADVIDMDAREVGQRREGIFFGIDGGVSKLAYALQGLMFWAILPLAGYLPDAASQPETAVMAFRFLMGGTPLIAALASVALLRMVRIPGAERPASPAAAPVG